MRTTSDPRPVTLPLLPGVARVDLSDVSAVLADEEDAERRERGR